MPVQRSFFLSPRLLLASSLALLVPLPMAAQRVHEGQDLLNSLSKADERLQPATGDVPIESAGSAAAEVTNGWTAFVQEAPGSWKGSIDRRTGRLAFAEGKGIPWLPGRGNKLAASDLSAYLPAGQTTVDIAVMEKIARSFLPKVAPLLGVDGAALVLDRGQSGPIADYLWFVTFDVLRDGRPIEGARVVFRVNNGNLIQLGSENLPRPEVAAPAAALTREEALASLGKYVGGFRSRDLFRDTGSLHLLPTAVSEGGRAARGLLSVWQFVFHREGVTGTWRGRVDAATGEVVELYDINDYAQANGGVFPNSPVFNNETVLPMPFADLSTGGFTSSAGLFSPAGPSAASTLNGKYVQIVDVCGSISQSASSGGDISFGASVGTDCVTPGNGGTGNTHSARMQFYHVNRAKEVGRGWLPSNTWLTQVLKVNVNLNQTCNAYWQPSTGTLNFFKSGGGCGNTGEIAGVSLHEYGHGLDDNDGNGGAPDHGSGETYGDFTSALATHNSCIGNGFLPSSCPGYGDACTSCSGVRDIDWAKHSSNVPHTVANFTQTVCPDPSTQNPGYTGPCAKEGHCESSVSSEALWDFANRDLPNPGTGAAWSTVDRLWYLSRSTATSAFSCTRSSPTWTSDGCATGSMWRAMRAVDDDDGNLANGTPHSCNLFAALNRHGIACASDAAANVCFSTCTPPATPTLTATAGDGQVQLSWTDSGPGTAYDLYRNEAGCNAGFTKIANDLAGTALVDSGVANGMTYFYQLVAQPTGSEACAAPPTSCQTATPVCVAPASPTGFTATPDTLNHIGLSWTAVAGATAYNLYRGTTAGGPYTLIATLAAPTTTYTDGPITGGVPFFYVVRAVQGCESAASSEATATATGGACVASTLYTTDFETGSGLTDWTTGSFLSGGTVADWRGIQTCTAHGGTKIFRFGGTGCTTAYANNQFNYAQPHGTAGITVPAGAIQNRLSFWHRWNFETGFDGGTLVVSIDGTNYEFVPSSAILSGTSYNGQVTTGAASCPPAGSGGAPTFTGSRSTFVNTVVDLDAACNAVGASGCAGHDVRIGFASVADCSSTQAGWFLDDVAVTTCTFPAAQTGAGFFTVQPCRLVDTRNANGPQGGPNLAPSSTRNFTLTGACGIPSTATSVSVNLTIVTPTADGTLVVYPAGEAAPSTQSITFKTSQQRANNAILKLSAGGAVSVQSTSTGTVPFLIDVNGYFQ